MEQNDLRLLLRSRPKQRPDNYRFTEANANANDITYSAPQLSGESHLQEPKFNVFRLGGEDKTLTGTFNGKDENQRGAEREHACVSW